MFAEDATEAFWLKKLSEPLDAIGIQFAGYKTHLIVRFDGDGQCATKISESQLVRAADGFNDDIRRNLAGAFDFAF